MEKRDRLFILLSLLVTLAPCVLVTRARPAPDQTPILLGWAVASLNFCAAVIISLNAMRKHFETFKLTVFAAMTIRMGLLLAVLAIVIKLKAEWSTAFSSSLLACFGIYIILEIILFFVKSKKMPQ
jgi:hypothetical protein